MKVLKIDHIGIAVKNMDEALKLYQDVLGLKLAAHGSGGRAEGEGRVYTGR